MREAFFVAARFFLADLATRRAFVLALTLRGVAFFLATFLREVFFAAVRLVVFFLRAADDPRLALREVVFFVFFCARFFAGMICVFAYDLLECQYYSTVICTQEHIGAVYTSITLPLGRQLRCNFLELC